MTRVGGFLILVCAAMLFATNASAKQKTITKPKAGSPAATVMAALRAGVAGNFQAYLKTVHPEHKETPRQRKERKKYEWKRFSKQASWYVVKGKVFGFQIVRRQPEGRNSIRLFIRDQRPDHASRMPVPVRLKRAGNEWKIVTSSL